MDLHASYLLLTFFLGYTMLFEAWYTPVGGCISELLAEWRVTPRSCETRSNVHGEPVRITTASKKTIIARKCSAIAN